MPRQAPEDEPQEQPLIRFGDQWLPAHQVWSKMETASVVADAIARFNERFPQLASAETRNVVPLVRQRLNDIELRMPEKAAPPDHAATAAALLGAMAPEAVIETLADRHGLALDLKQLVQLAGEKPYAGALQREARILELNRISPEQVAQLWNDAGRPVPGGGLWNAQRIGAMLTPPY
jgi:hypothetical protein